MRIDGKDNKDFHFEHLPIHPVFQNPDISFSTNVKAAQKVSYYLWYINPIIPASLNKDIHRIDITESQLGFFRTSLHRPSIRKPNSHSGSSCAAQSPDSRILDLC